MDKGRGIFDPSSFLCILCTVSRDDHNCVVGRRKKNQKGGIGNVRLERNS
jgi:hypothetical protein